MRVLVTGVAGFVGGHLVDLLLDEEPGVEVIGLDSTPGNRARSLGIEVIGADLEDPEAVLTALGRARPDRIVHLAAQSSPRDSWLDPARTFRTNLFGLLHLFEAALRQSLTPRVLVVGSAEEYGHVKPEELPVQEDTPLRPTTPYAASKVAQGYLALQYALSTHLHVVRTRTFHHTGPRRGAAFAESSFARQIAEIEAGLRPAVLEVGNLDAVRDFTDVRDVVRAYWALLEKGEVGQVYNVCSGKGVRIGELLDSLITHSGAHVEVRVDPDRLRSTDVPAMVGDFGRLHAATGWQPKVPLSRTLGDLLDHWRERVQTTASPSPPRSGRP